MIESGHAAAFRFYPLQMVFCSMVGTAKNTSKVAGQSALCLMIRGSSGISIFIKGQAWRFSPNSTG